MIENIVFDIGNVLATWNTRELICRIAGEGAAVEEIHQAVFAGEAWHRQERGECTRAQVEDALRLLYPGEKGQMYARIAHESNSVLHETENTDFVRALRARGYETYFLSNTNECAVRYMKEHARFWDYMTGGIASCDVGLEKPDPAIFRLFLTRYGKRAQTCLFIDDRQENVVAAASVGFHTIHLARMCDLREKVTSRLNIVL